MRKNKPRGKCSCSHELWNCKMPSVFARSEEHTSELQSLRHLVCRLLLEKKKETVPVFLSGRSSRRCPSLRARSIRAPEDACGQANARSGSGYVSAGVTSRDSAVE